MTAKTRSGGKRYKVFSESGPGLDARFGTINTSLLNAWNPGAERRSAWELVTYYVTKCFDHNGPNAEKEKRTTENCVTAWAVRTQLSESHIFRTYFRI